MIVISLLTIFIFLGFGYLSSREEARAYVKKIREKNDNVDLPNVIPEKDIRRDNKDHSKDCRDDKVRFIHLYVHFDKENGTENE